MREALLEDGLTATSIATITKRAGVTSEFVEYHFGSYRELVIAGIVRDMDEFSSKIIDAARAHAIDAGSMDRTMKAMTGAIEDLWDLYMDRTSLRAVEAALAAFRDDDLRARIGPELAKRMREVHRVWIEAYRGLGLSETVVVALLSMTCSLLRGLSVASLILGDRQHAKWISQEYKSQMVTTVVKMVADVMSGSKRSLYEKIGSLSWERVCASEAGEGVGFMSQVIYYLLHGDREI